FREASRSLTAKLTENAPRFMVLSFGFEQLGWGCSWTLWKANYLLSLSWRESAAGEYHARNANRGRFRARHARYVSQLPHRAFLCLHTNTLDSSSILVFPMMVQEDPRLL